MTSYPSGSIVKFRATFYANGRPVDPAIVHFAAQLNDGAWTDTITFTSATVPAVGTLARLGIGVYESWYDTTGTSGELVGRIWSTGVGQGSQIATVTIDPV